MKKSLKMVLCAGVVISTNAARADVTDFNNPNSAYAFSAEYLMNSALDVAGDVGMEQVNYSHNAGIKKAQEYLHGITNDVRVMLRNLEANTSSAGDMTASDIGNWVDSWGNAERINVQVSAHDTETARLGANVHQNRSFNLTLKFAKEHHVHHLDDVTFRWVPQISETQDGEISIQGWYCETDIDWVSFTRSWLAPAEIGSTAAVGQAVKSQRSMITRDLSYPFSACTVVVDDIAPNAGSSLELGITGTAVVNTVD